MPSIRALPTLATRTVFCVALLGAALLTATLPADAAESGVPLGSADSFAVLAGSGITNTGATTITGDIGTFPTPTGTGTDSITLIGTDHAGDAVTQRAKDALVTAYNDAFGRTPATSVPVELGGTTLTPGVYTSPTFGLTGVLTLDSGGDPEATFVFQAGSTLITEANSRVLLIGVDPCHVVWQVGSSATFKTGTDFVGDVLAHTSVTAQTEATFHGRLLALNGAVTLDTNTIIRADCLATAPATPTTLTTPTTTPDAPPAAVVPSGRPVAPPTSSAPAVSDGPLAGVPDGPLVKVPSGPPTDAFDGPPSGGPTAPPSPRPGPPATPPPLPPTGANVVGLMWTALILLTGGGALVLAERRGRTGRVIA